MGIIFRMKTFKASVYLPGQRFMRIWRSRWPTITSSPGSSIQTATSMASARSDRTSIRGSPSRNFFATSEGVRPCSEVPGDF